MDFHLSNAAKQPDERSLTRVTNEVDDSIGELTNLLKELVRIPTVNPPGENYAECAEFISKWATGVGMKTELIRVPDSALKRSGLELPRVSVLSTLRGGEGSGGTRTLHINGHYDVVPAGCGWAFEPFGGSISDGRMYGRGTTDMKCGIAAAMVAAGAIVRSGVGVGGDLVISATPDEETGGELDAGYLVNEGFIKGDAAIVAEGSRVNQVSLAHKGALWLEIKTRGRSAHGSSPQRGLNAVTNMAKIVTALDELGSNLEGRRTRSSSFFEEVPWPTLMVGSLVRGGVKVNVVPSESTCTIDRRFLPEESLDEIENEIESVVRRVASRVPGLAVESKRLAAVPSSVCSKDTEVARSLIESVRVVSGIDPRVIGVHGFTDAHFLSQLMPTAMYGPQILEKAHQEDEYVVLEEVVTAAKVFAVTALKYLGL